MPLIEIEGRQLKLTNLDKVLFPNGFTKGEVIDYYVKISPVMLPHLADRPATRIRFPNGVDAQSFFEKNAPSHTPDWVTLAPIPSGRYGTVTYVVIDSLATLVWAAQLAALELHVPMGTVSGGGEPSTVVFDLDPGPGTDVLTCGSVALRLRELLDHLGLECLAKTSGSKGMQVYLPLNTPTTYDETTPFAKAIGSMLERQSPKEVTTNMAKQERNGRIFIDWSQNVMSKTTVCVYSLRARDEPTVSTPVTWDEVTAAVESGDPSTLRFTAGDVLDRVAEHGDLFAGVAEVEQELPAFG